MMSKSLHYKCMIKLLGIVWNDTQSFLKAFADDVTIMTNTPGEMQQVTNALIKALGIMGLQLNVKKCRTQHMAVHEGGYMTHRPRIMACGQPIPHIQWCLASFTPPYRSCILSNFGNIWYNTVFRPNRSESEVLFTRATPYPPLAR